MTPEIDLTVFYEDGQIASNAEVVRVWHSYLDNESYREEFYYSDKEGKVKLPGVKRYLPILVQKIMFISSSSSPHESPSNVGSITARNPNNHYIWGEVQYRNDDCCPNQLVLIKHDREVTDSLFGK